MELSAVKADFTRERRSQKSEVKMQKQESRLLQRIQFYFCILTSDF
jgi:hypothetical protein